MRIGEEKTIEPKELFDPHRPYKAPLVLLICVVLLVLASLTGWLVQTDLGRIEVTNVTYRNFNGIPVRAKLLRPVQATPAQPAPGVVYIHGYQNNRETGDAYSIELARRGFVVLNIDAIGRGNSGEPNDPREANFDPTYGGASSVKHLRSLSFHTLALLAITSVISTYFFLITGKIYLGALVNAALVAWMFASSQVIAPVPI